MPQPFATATLLPNGKVLIAGDGDAELFDPETGTFATAGRFASPAHGFGATATLLSYGEVLLVGDSPAQLYDPATNTFGATDSLNSGFYRNGGDSEHSATLLSNGKVLIEGGGTADGGGPGVPDAELYDPVIGTFTAASGLASGGGCTPQLCFRMARFCSREEKATTAAAMAPVDPSSAACPAPSFTIPAAYPLLQQVT